MQTRESGAGERTNLALGVESSAGRTTGTACTWDAGGPVYGGGHGCRRVEVHRAPHDGCFGDAKPRFPIFGY